MNFLVFNYTQSASRNKNDINSLMRTFKQPRMVHEGYACPNPNCREVDSLIPEYEITESNDLLLIYCNAFQYDTSTQSMRKIENIKYENIPTSEIVLNSKTYKFNSAIFHIGNSIMNGHYISILRTENGFVECNDTSIRVCDWPKNSIYVSESKQPTNLYLMIYERVDETAR